MGGVSEYGRLDGLAMGALVRAGEVHPRELVQAALRAIEQVNGGINAIITPMAALALAAAEKPVPAGPFMGVPFVLKDLGVLCAGVPLHCGSRLFDGFVPDRDSYLVQRQRAAGLIVVGKTNTPELGLTPVTEPALFGPTRNPWHLEHTAGGSSGGSAAAVAAGIVPLAHGSDGGGSLRIPAACCGLFGFKPTRARTPMGPDRSESWMGYVVEHGLSRTVRDSAALLDATAGADRESPYWPPPANGSFLAEVGREPGRLRVAFTTRPQMPATVHPDCLAAAEATAALLASLGHHVEVVDPPLDPWQFARDFFTLVAAEVARTIESAARALGRPVRRRDFETNTWLTAMVGRGISGLEMGLARDRLQALARAMANFFGDFDLLLSPTLALPPPLHGSVLPSGFEAWTQRAVAALNWNWLLRLPGAVEASVKRVFSFMPFTALANVTGQPAMSLPLHWNGAGLPIGVQITGRFGDEATLFRVAGQLEQARPWRDRRPPLYAT